METARSTLQNVHEVSFLQKPHIHMKDVDNVMKKINSIIQGGKDKLQVIFDYDRTITKYHVNDVPTLSSFCLIESSLPKDIHEQSQAVLEKYHPIEVDPHLSEEEKTPYMVEWWTLGIELLKGVPWNTSIMETMLKKVDNWPLTFRDGTMDCFSALKSAGVPVLVFSAGIGDIVEGALGHCGLLSSNVHIISNFLKLEDDRIMGYQGDIIHVFNKSEQAIQDTPYYAELKNRDNVILLGDSTGDAKMADGVPHNTVLKIGFLNVLIEESLPLFMEVFDIVLTDDQTMDVLKHILSLCD